VCNIPATIAGSDPQPPRAPVRSHRWLDGRFPEVQVIEHRSEREGGDSDDHWLVEGLLRTEVTRTSSSVVLTLQGELDVNTAGQLRQEVMALVDAERRLVIDTSGLTFCGSSGIAVFVEAHDEARARGAQLRIVVPPGALRRAVEAVGLLDYLPITSDLSSALEQV
jgi:anti-sigma B factor antagonist